MLGILRVVLLVPELGVRTAELLEMPLMLALALLALAELFAGLAAFRNDAVDLCGVTRPCLGNRLSALPAGLCRRTRVASPQAWAMTSGHCNLEEFCHSKSSDSLRD
ncbi:MAG: hypothetical protein U5L08_13770 [Xanthomonadales bacterium]|nr:hypothetical protein [Xanthomonadales bacterium]